MEKAESAPAASESRDSKWQMPINRILWKNRPFQTNLISSFSCLADVIAAGIMDGALCASVYIATQGSDEGDVGQAKLIWIKQMKNR